MKVLNERRKMRGHTPLIDERFKRYLNFSIGKTDNNLTKGIVNDSGNFINLWHQQKVRKTEDLRLDQESQKLRNLHFCCRF